MLLSDVRPYKIHNLRRYNGTVPSLCKFDCVIVVGEQGCERKASVADSIVRVGLPVVVSKIASVRVTSLFYRNKKIRSGSFALYRGGEFPSATKPQARLTPLVRAPLRAPI